MPGGLAPSCSKEGAGEWMGVDDLGDKAALLFLSSEDSDDFRPLLWSKDKNSK